MKPNAIVIHCSASRWGDAAVITEWHKARGFYTCGYNAVILNGHRSYAAKYVQALDGKIEPGRPENVRGAHCAAGGMNSRSLGVCLIGIPDWDKYPTPRQMAALIHYLTVKCRLYGILPDTIFQHSDFDKGKPLCASLGLKPIQAAVRASLAKAA